MPFDLSTAQPVKASGFDLNSAEPVGKADDAGASTPASYLDRVKSQVLGSLAAVPDATKNLTLGAVRGAGTIGSMLLWPIDAATDAITGDRQTKLSDLVKAGGGPVQAPLSRHQERLRDMNKTLQDVGADPDSLAFKTGTLGGEIAGTAGAGGLIGNVVGRVAGAIGLSSEAVPLVNALASNGFKTGATQSIPANLLTRAAGGAMAGGAQVGLVDPENAGTGAAIGAALPGAAKVLGSIGNALGGASLSPARADAVAAARAAGFKLPPTEMNPSALNTLAEGLSGKVKTAQAASMDNQTLTNALTAQELGLPEGSTVTKDALKTIRQQASEPYKAVSNLPPMSAAGADLPSSVTVKTFNDPLTLARKSEVDPSDLVQQWRQANSDASGYFNAYKRDANPETLTKARAAASDAKKIDDFLETRLNETGQSDLLDKLKDARVQIAKTYSIEKVLNDTTGDVASQGLAKQLQKGKPLSGNLLTIAKTADAFPKAMQTLPQNYNALSPLDFAIGAMTQHDPGSSGLSTLLGHTVAPLAFPLARVGTRAAIMSEPYQNFAADSSMRNRLAELAAPAAYRAIPSTARN